MFSLNGQIIIANSKITKIEKRCSDIADVLGKLTAGNFLLTKLQPWEYDRRILINVQSN